LKHSIKSKWIQWQNSSQKTGTEKWQKKSCLFAEAASMLNGAFDVMEF